MDPSTDRTRAKPGRRWLPALAALGLGVALTWPVALDPAGALVGHPGDDVWNHVWGYQYVADALARGELPLRTELLSWPNGGALWFIDTAQAAILAPVTWTLGAAVAYNLAMILGLAGSALAAGLLARQVTGSAGAALLAGVVYGASPHLLGQAWNGISETVAAWGLPLALLATLALLERPGPRAAVGLGLAGAAAALVSWYGGLFAALGAGALVLTRGLRDPRGLGRLLPWLALAGGVALALCAPALLAFRATLEAGDALVTRDPDFVRASLMHHNLTDALAYVRPGKTPSPDLHALFGEDLIIVVYVGLVALGAAAVGVARARRGEAAPWLTLLGLSFVLSLGPYLYVGGGWPTVDGRKIPLPFLPLFDALPLLGRVSHPFRFATCVSLAVGVLGALGVARATRPSLHAPIALALGAAFLLEVRLGSPAGLPVPSSRAELPAICRTLAEDPEPGAVLDLPLSLPNLERAVYLWHQTCHGRPVPWGLNEPMPALLLDNRLTAALLRLETGAARALPERLPELELALGARLLARQGLRYVVVHGALYPEQEREQVEALLSAVLGPPLEQPDPGLTVYRLDRPGGLD